MYGNLSLAKIEFFIHFSCRGTCGFLGRVSKMADPRTTSSEGLSVVYRDTMFPLERSEIRFSEGLSLAVFGHVVW